MGKTQISPEQIVTILNSAMVESEELDGDCKECQVRRVSRVTDEEAKHLKRNWNVDMVNGECRGECMKVLEETAKIIGLKFDVTWPL